MPSQTSDIMSDLFDWDALTDEEIELSPAQVAWAVDLSQPIANSRRRWQTYLHALALAGFKQWIEEWAPDLTVRDADCSLLQPQYASLIEAGCNLQIGSFSLCLIATGNLMDTVINLPKAAIDLPQFNSHFYVLVEVLEESMQIRIHGYARHRYLVEQQLSVAQTNSGWSYTLPLNWFTPNPHALLLELRCLEPSDILWQNRFTQSLVSPAQLQAKLTEFLPQLQASKGLLDSVLTWEEGATLLTQPELVSWLYRMQHADTANQKVANFSQEVALSPDSQTLTASSQMGLGQKAVNVGLWLRDQIDTLAQDLSWVLMPTLTATPPALRAAVEDLERVMLTLEDQGIVIPAEARGAYRNLRSARVALRLYAVAWSLPDSHGDLDWTLLLVLGTQSGEKIPAGVRLWIWDGTRLLMERVADGIHDSYLCIQVAGGWTEQFWVTVDLTHDDIITLLPFTFNPDSLS